MDHAPAVEAAANHPGPRPARCCVRLLLMLPVLLLLQHQLLTLQTLQTMALQLLLMLLLLLQLLKGVMLLLLLPLLLLLTYSCRRCFDRMR